MLKCFHSKNNAFSSKAQKRSRTFVCKLYRLPGSFRSKTKCNKRIEMASSCRASYIIDQKMPWTLEETAKSFKENHSFKVWKWISFMAQIFSFSKKLFRNMRCLHFRWSMKHSFPSAWNRVPIKLNKVGYLQNIFGRFSKESKGKWGKVGEERRLKLILKCLDKITQKLNRP